MHETAPHEPSKHFIPALSVVLPVHNEEGNIGRLVSEIADIVETSVRQPCEIIVVDDASTDRSALEADAAGQAAQEAGRIIRMTVMTSAGSTGQSEALMRGMEAAAGSIIITMDADLQHDPADLPALLSGLHGHDMVCGIRRKRTDGMLRLLSSRIANRFRNLLTGDRTTDSGCTFRAMRRDCLPLLLPLRGRFYGCEFFFHPLALRKKGFSVTECKVNHRDRISGKSNYRLFRGRFIVGLMACLKARRAFAKNNSATGVR